MNNCGRLLTLRLISREILLTITQMANNRKCMIIYLVSYNVNLIDIK